MPCSAQSLQKWVVPGPPKHHVLPVLWSRCVRAHPALFTQPSSPSKLIRCRGVFWKAFALPGYLQLAALSLAHHKQSEYLLSTRRVNACGRGPAASSLLADRRAAPIFAWMFVSWFVYHVSSSRSVHHSFACMASCSWIIPIATEFAV